MKKIFAFLKAVVSVIAVVGLYAGAVIGVIYAGNIAQACAVRRVEMMKRNWKAKDEAVYPNLDEKDE